MKIVLISPAHPRVENDNLDPPIGLMYLSAVLCKAGHSVKILDYAGDRQHNVPEADIYGFTTYTPTYWWSLEKKNEIQELYPNAKYICGGTHASAVPELCKDNWDYVVVGEGEEAILRLASGDTLPKIIYSNSLDDVDNLPFPDYADIDVDSYDRTLDGEPLLSVLTSRGCPYKCNFCNSIIWNGARKVRFRSPENVAKEIAYLKDTFGINHFRMIDDLFAITETRVKNLTEVFKDLDIVYRCTARCNTFNDIMAKMLKDSGCVQVELGVESGSLPILERMNKKQTPDDIIYAVHSAKNAGLRVRIYLIMGFPGETWETVKETCKTVIEAMPDEVLIHTPIPFPGTPLYEYPDDFGITWMEKDFSKYMQISKDRQPYYLMSHKTADRDIIKEMWEYTVKKLSCIEWYGGKK